MGLALDTGVVEDSRAALLAEIGSDHDLTLVRGPGNVGDELILAGVRSLLRDRNYREIDCGAIARTGGDVALICAGGCWCRPYHEWAPRALAIAEMRFRRVVVLPASFDVGEDVVRDALARTSATVFAREHESLRLINGVCRARVAHDCAFFFDYSDYVAPGEGTLHAFRTDRESGSGRPGTDDNNDLSLTAASLDSFLRTIAGYEHVRTDRAHVMIAAALLGKSVEFAEGSYFKLGALADSWLRGYPVARIDPPRRLNAVARPARRADTRAARVTVVVLTRDRREPVAAAVRSALAGDVPVRALVIGNNPDQRSRLALRELAATDPRIDLRVLDRNLGCGGGRRLASELVDTEFTMFLDDDAALAPGALERLVEDLDSHPEAVGVTALVVGSDGTVSHCGAEIEHGDDVVAFTLGGGGLALEDDRVPASGPSGWLPGTAALIRTAALRHVPIDPGPSAYYEDNEWSFRMRAEYAEPFRRCREAVVVHDNRDTTAAHSCELAQISWLAERLAAQAQFLERHGLLLDVDLVHLIPELRLPDGSIDVPAARLLLELVLARGTDWLVAEWMGGGLEPLLGRAAVRASIADAAAAHERLEAEQQRLTGELTDAQALTGWLLERHLALERVENGGWWRLRTRLLPAVRIAGAARGHLSGATRVAAAVRRMLSGATRRW